jgi:hypothetical protein
MSKLHTSPKPYRLLIFWVGIIATISYRIIVVFNDISPMLVKITWYVGTIGFVWYFAHRYRVENQRERLIRERRLMDKLCTNKLSTEDCEALRYIIGGLSSSKAKWNYIAIFVFSALALAYGVWTDFLV